MSNPTTRYLKNKKSRKAISPVIATVILVAVAVVIAAAMAGFSSSLFGTYSNTAQVQVKQMTISASDLSAASTKLVVDNHGASPDQIIKVSVPGTDLIDTTTHDVAANGLNQVIGIDLSGGSSVLNSGQQITVKIEFASGSTVAQSVTVQQ